MINKIYDAGWELEECSPISVSTQTYFQFLFFHPATPTATLIVYLNLSAEVPEKLIEIELTNEIGQVIHTTDMQKLNMDEIAILLSHQ